MSLSSVEPELLAALIAFREIAVHRSIHAAARATGRSRASYNRALRRLEAAFGARLIDRARGQREGTLTAAGRELDQQGAALIERLGRWAVSTLDRIGDPTRGVRVGALGGAFDLISSLLEELREESAGTRFKIVEYAGDRLIPGVLGGEVDLGFGPLPSEGTPGDLGFESLGPLGWSVIAPRAMRRALGEPTTMSGLDGVPLVVTRVGPARELIEREFARHAIELSPVCEVESTPRIVELVARGFGAAIVSQFRLAFVPRGILVRTLVDGPPPVQAGVFTRRGAPLPREASVLLDRARARFRTLAGG